MTTSAVTFGGRRRLIWTTAEEVEELRPAADTKEHRMRSLAGKARTVLSGVGQDERHKQTAAMAKDVAEPAHDDLRRGVLKVLGGLAADGDATARFTDKAAPVDYLSGTFLADLESSGKLVIEGERDAAAWFSAFLDESPSVSKIYVTRQRLGSMTHPIPPRARLQK